MVEFQKNLDSLTAKDDSIPPPVPKKVKASVCFQKLYQKMLQIPYLALYLFLHKILILSTSVHHCFPQIRSVQLYYIVLTHPCNLTTDTSLMFLPLTVSYLHPCVRHVCSFNSSDNLFWGCSLFKTTKHHLYVRIC